MQVTFVGSTVLGATLNCDPIVTHTFVEKDEELKTPHCKDSVDPKQRNAPTAETARAAAERVAA